MFISKGLMRRDEMATTITFTTQEMTILQAALRCYNKDRQAQVHEAMNTNNKKIADYFENQRVAALELYAKVYFAGCADTKTD
jgi:predicted type IV restriction endonuclease